MIRAIKKYYGYAKQGDWFEFKYLILSPIDDISWLLTRIMNGLRYFTFGFNDQSWNGYKFDELIVFKLKLIRKIVAKDTIYIQESNRRDLKEIDLIIRLLERSMNYENPALSAAHDRIETDFVTCGKKGYVLYTILHKDPQTGLPLEKEEERKRWGLVHMESDREDRIKEMAFVRAMKILNKKRFSWD